MVHACDGPDSKEIGMRLLKELAWLILESVERFNVLDGEQGQVGDSRTEGGQINVQALHRIRERVDERGDRVSGYRKPIFTDQGRVAPRGRR